jgi:nicotinic acid mononucleotide adenylyltransferase
LYRNVICFCRKVEDYEFIFNKNKSENSKLIVLKEPPLDISSTQIREILIQDKIKWVQLVEKMYLPQNCVDYLRDNSTINKN